MCMKTRSEVLTLATDLEKKLTENRIILVNGYIDTDAASYIVFQLLQLSALSDTEPIQLFIGSYGGNYLDMLAIYDTICSIPNPLRVWAWGAVSNYARCFWRLQKGFAFRPEALHIQHRAALRHVACRHKSANGNCHCLA